MGELVPPNSLKKRKRSAAHKKASKKPAQGAFGAGSTGRPEHTAPSRNKPYAMLEYTIKRQIKKSVFD
ncbi:MAG: hypothetical protein LBD13_00730, partial [Spirochaetaceae bacterium]|nr:hypothetical protein [Spirochaetaceae bacterium]